MATDYSKRLKTLTERRQGYFPPMQKAVTAFADSAFDSAAKFDSAPKPEGFLGRARGEATRYALGALQAVDPEYTRNSYEEGDRVKAQLEGKLAGNIPVEFRYQGSVPLDIHIKGASDIDMLVLLTNFRTYNPNGRKAQAGSYCGPATEGAVARLTRLRTQCETILVDAFPAADVDTSGSKSIALSGGSLRRKVDVVPSHWYDTLAYQTSSNERDRAVSILVKDEKTTIDNWPFLHMARINEKDTATAGGTKKIIRLLKTLRSDSDYQNIVSELSSYDIASLVWHFDPVRAKVTREKEMSLVSLAKVSLEWCANNKTGLMALRTPDDSRCIIDSEAKFRAVGMLSLDIDGLAEAVAGELATNGYSRNPVIVRRLEEASILA